MKPVRCVHPAWFTHVPPGSRKERDTLVRMTTPVELRPWTGGLFGSKLEVSRNNVFDHGRALILHGSDRGYWQRLHATDGSPIGSDDLVEYLEGRPVVEPKALGLGHCFAGTPVAAFAGIGTWYWQDRRGKEPDPRGLGQVRTGDPAAASATLVSFLDTNVAIHKDGVMMRTRPVAVTTGEGQTDGWQLRSRRRFHQWRALAASSATYPRIRDARKTPTYENWALIDAWVDYARYRPDPDADLVHMLNDHASPVLERLAATIPRKMEDDVAHAALATRYADLKPIARRSDLGLAGTVDLVLEVEALCSAVDCLATFTGGRSMHQVGIEALAENLREFVAPRIRAMLANRVPDEDVQALSGLGPI